ncbi:RING-H2 finger protein ATL2-like [Abrus precatorius]|uniref:RING-type E3 ubiquitin transferase n=1 Tax=Abrus precatorius TaxID=3816 RepID=A0A8B8JPZ0_ABRPR|nr:RING-H2 finger protein ATL2-like [Abrus precatorius]
MGNDDVDGNGKEIQYESKDFALSGKIMLIAIVVLFLIIIIMLCLHVYVRWHLVRARRRRNIRRARRPHFVFYMDPTVVTVASRGLHRSVISSLPVFTFSHTTHPDPVECAVCLSEFENGETGRVLPKCNHSFHIDCIDMWFQSHSTCPLCRSPVETRTDIEARPEGVALSEPESSLSSELGVGGEELNGYGAVGSSSLRVEVQGRNHSLRVESESSFRSPVSRILSFKRILSREKTASVSGCGGGCSDMTDLDTER